MSLKSRLPVIAALGAFATCGFAADSLRMSMAPALEGFSPPYGTVPVAVNLRNDGPDAKGTVRVIGTDGFQMDYPVELPRGAQKRLITYPSLSYGTLRFVLDTNQGRVFKNYEPGAMGVNSAGKAILLVSDNAGELSFMRGKEKGAPDRDQYGREDQNLVQDAYTSPDLAPNRPVGYANVAAVMLGSGAERLNDEQIAAIKLYAVAGGTLVFVGGASSPILGDARWQDVLPVHNLRVVNLPDSRGLERLGGEPAPPTSVMTGDPVEGAVTRRDGSTLLTADRLYGIGKVVYLAFNPLEAPLNRWEGRQSAVTKAVRLSDAQLRAHFLDQFAGGGQSSPYGSFIPTGSSGIYAPTGRPVGVQDPFSTQLPPAEKVFTLLGAYFLVVVPLNFLVLKKLKRGEWAWFTAPLISLGFAGAFFSSAKDLYSAKMSTAAQGVIVAQQGLEEGLFVGSGQLFIPQSGTYDLKLQGVDSLGIAELDQPYSRGFGNDGSSEAEFDPVDVGEVRVQHMQANNLAFRAIELRQRVPVGKWFSIEAKPTDGHHVRVVVRNTGPYRLANASVMVGSTEKHLKDLQPGESREVEVLGTVNPQDGQPRTWSMEQVLGRYRGVALIGTIEGYRPGPQLGEQVKDRTSIRLALIAKEGLGPQ